MLTDFLGDLPPPSVNAEKKLELFTKIRPYIQFTKLQVKNKAMMQKQQRKPAMTIELQWLLQRRNTKVGVEELKKTSKRKSR
ncbi:hypothetical protein PHMEG_0003509 [Phytophthora megakarya]|uniref:Uncharacterized protein n=1 Tax=Phytophthora megakarya TaxID=4795 RepID=A0A225WYJ2_9STRA|nr:hypothetical protein PHMEG_0003509 [Phytophthora megakarya]